jgi:hypothetical protein
MKRTLVFAALASLSALTLGACATSEEGATSTHLSDRARLERDCTARGGILVPTGHVSAHPELDNVCDVTNSPNPTPIPAP